MNESREEFKQGFFRPVIRSWLEVDADGVEWWKAQQVYSGNTTEPLGPVSTSRISRARAEAYALAEIAAEVHRLT